MHAAEGIPDIHIDAPGLLVLVEVKKGSDLHSGQLSQYHSMLDRRKQSTKRLVLLTAFAANFIEEEKPDRWVRWGEVANWINQRLPKDLVAHYLTTQFLAFLRSQVMAIEKVEWQYIEGTKALYNFTTMLGQALQNSGVPIYRVSGTWDSRGHYIASGGQFWTGINMDKPHLLRFQFETAKPDLELLKQHGWQFQDGKYVTTLDLSSESIHFFARSQDSQLDCLTDFVRNAFQVGTRCTKPQPAQQEEPASDTATLQ